MSDNSRGGNDTLIGGDSSTNYLHGDAYSMSDSVVGGSDILTGGIGATNTLVGDAGSDMSNSARGGNDSLTGGGRSSNILIGDAYSRSAYAVGGRDTLIGGGIASTNILIGDAAYISDNARCGNDRLVSGSASTDHMWGDALFIDTVAAFPSTPLGAVRTGADTFVFGPNNGNDDINDFRQSDHDRIDVSAYGFHSLADLTITAVGGNTKIAFDANNSVTLVGVTDPSVLKASDFIFA